MSVSPPFSNSHIESRVWLGYLLSFVLAFFVLGSAASNAAESAGKEGDSQYVKVPPLTVNLHDLTHFLQIKMTLKVSDPALAKTVKENMPIVRNELTYLLSDKDAGQIESLAGRQMLIQQIRSVINKALSLTGKNGVTEVFLENMVVQ